MEQRKRRNETPVQLDGFAQQAQQLLESHRWSITPKPRHAWWAQGDAGPPQQVWQVLFVLVPLCVHCKAERQVVYSHNSRSSEGLAGLADPSDKVVWSLYSGLLGLKFKIPQIYCWVLQLLARIPLTANLDVWKSPKSDLVYYFLVSFPCPSKTSVQKNFCIIKPPFKYPSDPSQRMSVLLDARTTTTIRNVHSRTSDKRGAQDRHCAPVWSWAPFGQEVTVCLQRAPKSFIIYG